MYYYILSLLLLLLYLSFKKSFLIFDTRHRMGDSQFPDQGLKLPSLRWKQSLNHWTAREVPTFPFHLTKNIYKFFIFFFNWSSVNSQWCASLFCTGKWLSFTHIYVLFSHKFSKLCNPKPNRVTSQKSHPCWLHRKIQFIMWRHRSKVTMTIAQNTIHKTAKASWGSSCSKLLPKSYETTITDMKTRQRHNQKKKLIGQYFWQI